MSYTAYSDPGMGRKLWQRLRNQVLQSIKKGLLIWSEVLCANQNLMILGASVKLQICASAFFR